MENPRSRPNFSNFPVFFLGYLQAKAAASCYGAQPPTAPSTHNTIVEEHLLQVAFDNSVVQCCL